MMQKYENNGPAPMPADEKWMDRCLQLARAGAAGAPPNPMVGAVIVHDGRILGEGYHARCGTAHAEVNAIRAVRPDDRPLLKASTLYVSLEPCAHYGRTPPCAELIVRTGIGRVVVGCIDPFARVSGRGIDILRRAGLIDAQIQHSVPGHLAERIAQQQRLPRLHANVRKMVVDALQILAVMDAHILAELRILSDSPHLTARAQRNRGARLRLQLQEPRIVEQRGAGRLHRHMPALA